ncbi:MAG: nitrophenyl compound nitroreductase subunit ArsF family protein [Candidatus Riflebacteria bacterium]
MIRILERYKDFLTRFLLVFVIFSVGFAFGKHSEKKRSADAGQIQALTRTASKEDKGIVRLYYMHAMFRCVTCNSIEERAKRLTEIEFANELSSGIMAWEEINFQQNQPLAAKFDVVSSCVVVAVVKNGEIQSFERLDQLWSLLEKQEEFDSCIRTAVKCALEKI